MRRARATAVAFMYLAVALSASAVFTDTLTRPADYRLMLESRQLVPEAGVSERLMAEPETMRAGHVIVQFHDIPNDAEVRAMQSRGIRLLDYLPNMAYFASLSAGALDHLARLGGVRAVLPLEPRDKVSPRIWRHGVSEHARREDGTADIMVTFFRDVAIDRALEVAAVYGAASDVMEDERVLTLNISEDLIDDLASHDEVQWIEETPPPVVLLLDKVRATVGADLVQAAPYNLDGSGTALGMWENDGPAATHADFAGRLYLPDGAPPGWHATRVAGIMAGDGTGSEAWGGTPYQWRGLATAADIVSYTLPGLLTLLRVETSEAIGVYGIMSCNNSWGWFVCGYACSKYGDYDAWSRQYDKMVRGAQGAPINVVFGAGNERDCFACEDSLAHFPYGTVSSPGATAKNTIGVGAVNSISRTMTSFSGWGPTHDGRVKPDLVGPGCSDSTGVMGPSPPNDYADSLCGTSWSTPVITGATGILRHQFDLLGYTDVMPHTYKAVLIQTAEDLGNPGPDYAYGFGLLDLKKAVDLVIADYPSNELIRADSVSDSLMNAYYMDVESGAAGFRVTLVWDDFQATAAAAKTLINDLDLVVRSPGGTPYYAYTLDPDDPSAAATTGYNDVDNVEVVEVTGPEAGRWSVEVRGTLVPEGPQHYTLALPYDYATGGIDEPVRDGLGFRLLPASPNPFKGTCAISFEMAGPAAVRLCVYDTRGRLVRTLIDGAVRSAGRHVVRWDGADGEGMPVSPGVFFLRMETSSYSGTERVVLIK
jgi:hypothetical protein